MLSCYIIMQPAQINDNIIILYILYLDVVLTETSGQNLDFLEYITVKKRFNGSSDDDNLILVHILHRHTSKIFAIIVYVMPGT